MSRLVMATRHAPGDEPEAEPVVVEVEAGELTLTLDDGEVLALDLEDIQRAVDGERLPSESEAA